MANYSSLLPALISQDKRAYPADSQITPGIVDITFKNQLNNEKGWMGKTGYGLLWNDVLLSRKHFISLNQSQKMMYRKMTLTIPERAH